MSLPPVVSRDEWLIARKELLAREKQLTRERDALNAERRRLPMIEIDKEYVFEGPEGKATLPRSARAATAESRRVTNSDNDFFRRRPPAPAPRFLRKKPGGLERTAREAGCSEQ